MKRAELVELLEQLLPVEQKLADVALAKAQRLDAGDPATQPLLTAHLHHTKVASALREAVRYLKFPR